MRRLVNTTAIMAVMIATLFACTKDVKDAQVNIQQDNLSAISGKSINGIQQLKPQEQSEKKPLLIAGQGNGPAYVGKPVTVTYAAADADTKATIGCGKLTIYQWKGTEWIPVVESNDPIASFTFTPETTAECTYKFRAGFAPGGSVKCQGSYAGVNYEDLPQSDFCVLVQQECVEHFTITSDVKATPSTNGQYVFEITYTLTSPIDVNDVKFQGGATAGGNVGSTITDLGNTTEVNVNRNNTVLKWDGNLKACTPQKVYFKFKRNFTCPASNAEITGDWSASAGDTELGSKRPLTYSCN